LSFTPVIVIYIYNFTCRHSTQSSVKCQILYGYLLFTVLHTTLVYIRTIIQGHSQSRHETADRTLAHVVHVSTVA
jgi:hypothetical protein